VEFSKYCRLHYRVGSRAVVVKENLWEEEKTAIIKL